MRPRWDQDGPKMRPGVPKMAPGRRKMDAGWPPEAHKLVQDGARRGQNGGQMAPQLANAVFINVLNSSEDLPRNLGQRSLDGARWDKLPLNDNQSAAMSRKMASR